MFRWAVDWFIFIITRCMMLDFECLHILQPAVDGNTIDSDSLGLGEPENVLVDSSDFNAHEYLAHLSAVDSVTEIEQRLKFGKYRMTLDHVNGIAHKNV